MPRGDSSDPPQLPDGCAYLAGQLERGEQTDYEHWQFVSYWPRKKTLSAIRRVWPNGHHEPTRSAAARDYVFKEQTRIGEPFIYGELPVDRSNSTDWERIRSLAQQNQLAQIPPDIYVRCFSQITRIASYHLVGVAVERTVVVFWGGTGLGKSRRAWAEAGLQAYPKDPLTKWWDGYRGMLFY